MNLDPDPGNVYLYCSIRIHIFVIIYFLHILSITQFYLHLHNYIHNIHIYIISTIAFTHLSTYSSIKHYKQMTNKLIDVLFSMFACSGDTRQSEEELQHGHVDQTVRQGDPQLLHCTGHAYL